MFDNLTTPGTIDDERNGMNHMHIKLAPGSHMQCVDLSRIMGNSKYTVKECRPTTPGNVDDERNGMNHVHIKLAPGSHMQRVDLSRIMGNSNYTIMPFLKMGHLSAASDGQPSLYL